MWTRAWLDRQLNAGPDDGGAEIIAVIERNEDEQEFPYVLVLDQSGRVNLIDADDGERRTGFMDLGAVENFAHEVLAYCIRKRLEAGE